MGIIKDLTNQRFGKLVVLYDTGKRKNRQAVWHCKCDCGNECDVVGGALRSLHTTSCGCSHHESRVEDLVGKTFNQLIVLQRKGSDERRRAIWDCQCTCGNHRLVTTTELKSGDVKSCKECSQKSMLNNLQKIQKEYYPIDYTKTKWYKEIINQKFGKLTAVEPTQNKDNAGHIIWKCFCDCGNPNPVYVSSNALKTENTLSCGCLKGTSLGEEQISKLLIQYNIPFERQFTFSNLKSPKQTVLRYDFAIFNNNHELQYLIEYDGIQHFIPIDYFGGEEGFKYRKLCDNLKTEYCKNNNIPLIRLNYLQKEITIEDITL